MAFCRGGPVTMLLEVQDLQTKFFTVDGVVNAVNGISYSVDRGECLAIVGESGSGKTVGVLSILQLIQSPPGRIVGGQISFKGNDLLSMSPKALSGRSGQRDLLCVPGSDDVAQPGHENRRPDRRESHGS